MIRILTDAERTLWEARRTKAEATYDALMTGKLAEEFIDQNGEKVRYTKTNAKDLARYIAEITALLNPQQARANAPRPMRFMF